MSGRINIYSLCAPDFSFMFVQLDTGLQRFHKTYHSSLWSQKQSRTRLPGDRHQLLSQQVAGHLLRRPAGYVFPFWYLNLDLTSSWRWPDQQRVCRQQTCFKNEGSGIWYVIEKHTSSVTTIIAGRAGEHGKHGKQGEQSYLGKAILDFLLALLLTAFWCYNYFWCQSLNIRLVAACLCEFKYEWNEFS